MGHSPKAAAFLIESRLAEAADGDVEALYALGVAYSAGADGTDVDLIEAHKWFNLAALNGSERAQQSRAEIADYMSAREIAQAQRQARAWLSGTCVNRIAA
jgi:TPR repeat protein